MPDNLEFLNRVAEEGTERPPTTTLEDFFASLKPQLGRRDRQAIVRQALWMLEGAYVHLPQKRAMYAIDPLQQLRLMHYRLDEMAESRLGSDLEFHSEMTAIFNSLRDLHTNYLLPSPFKEAVAYLPFLIEEHKGSGEHEGPCYIVSKVASGYRRPPFGEGVEVLDWNGVPIGREVELIAERQAGSNPAARHACGLNALTIRPLVRALPPDERWVVLGYRTEPGGKRLELKQDWLVFKTEPGFAWDPARRSPGSSLAIGLDLQSSQIQETRKRLFAKKPKASARAPGTPPSASTDETWERMDLRAKRIPTKNGEFGYIRIHTFMVKDADAFVQDFIDLVGTLPRNGLVIDVRGNSGGLIWAAERLLQILTPRRIEPEQFQFINSPLTLAICRKCEDLKPWSESIAQAVETGALHSLSFPITDPASCNAIGQRYYGPVVLITDAVCFSATDIFAAGFSDHGIGKILGTNQNTGAGGANVWHHDELLNLARVAQVVPKDELPARAEMRVAIRRSLRVGAKAGVPVEDIGIAPEFYHQMTRDDLLHDNVDLLEEAGKLLSDLPQRWLEIEVKKRTPHRLHVTAKATGVHQLDVLVDERSQRWVELPSGTADITIDLPGSEHPRVEFRGYSKDNELVACYRM